MKKIILFAIFSFALTVLSAQQLQWNILKIAGGNDADIAYSICLDNSGNTYVAGDFYSNVCYADSFQLDNISGSFESDIFLLKYDPAGNASYAKAGHGFDSDYMKQMDINDYGQLLFTGFTLSDTLWFDSINTHTNFYACSYDSAGNLRWAKDISNTGAGLSITHDRSGNGIIGGHFSSDTIYTLTDTLINTSAISSGVILKIDTLGNLVAGKQIDGAGTEMIESVFSASDGSILVSGIFDSDSINIGNQVLYNYGVGGYDIFLVKLDSLLEVDWALSVGGTGFDRSSRVSADQAGNIYLTGLFGSLDCIVGADTLRNTDTIYPIGGHLSYEMFMAKINSTGNYNWVKQWKGKSNEVSECAPILMNNRIYVAINFGSDTLILNTDTIINPTPNNYSILLSCFDDLGQTVFNEVYTNGFVTDISGHFPELAMTGVANSSVFTLGNLSSNITTDDIFTARATVLPVGITAYKKDDFFIVYPNPVTDDVKIVSNETVLHLQVFDSTGQLILSINHLEKEQSIHLPHQGIYYLAAEFKTGREARIVVKE